jgi:ABC-type multidrug transport system fused ATPase/permease subunit
MYLLFMLLQGRAPTLERWWMPRTILSAALLTSGLVVVRAMADVFSSRLVFRNIQDLYNDLLLRLTQGYSQMRWSRFVERNRSELTNHALNTAREAADFYHRCIEMVAGAATVAVMTIALIYQSPISALGFACALTAFYGVHRLFIRRKVQEAASNREQFLSLLNRNVAGMFSAGKEMRTYRNQAFFLDRICEQAKRLAVSNHRIVLLPQVARVIADQGTVLLFLCMIIAVELQKGDTRQLLSLLAFYFVLSRRLLPLISQLSLIAGQMESSYQNVRIVDSELKECCECAITKSSASLPAAGLAAELCHVDFWFQKDAPILRDVNISLHKGETIVLRGVSGSGKSALLDLIAGLSQPVGGVVRVDRAGIAYVPQDIPLLDDSIRNNLLFGLPQKSDDQLVEALALARLDESVAALPLGLETGVGDNGVLFSGGERQRLGLARAILRGGQLLLLDEATSALDEENERRVLENLRASGLAIVLVTHRLHALQSDHREYRLQDGYLIEVPRPHDSESVALAAFATDSRSNEIRARAQIV